MHRFGIHKALNEYACRTSTVLLAAGMVLSVLTSCARWPSHMQPIALERSPQKSLSMVVATTRAKSHNPDIGYSGERGRQLSIENVVVSIPAFAARKPGEVELPSRFDKGDPDKAFLVTNAEPLDEPGIHAWYAASTGPKRRVLIFVHGFNYSYYESVIRFGLARKKWRANP